MLGDCQALRPRWRNTALSSESVRGRAETWDVKEHDCTSHQARQNRVDETVNEIANRLTKILEQSGEDNDGDAALPAKIGEICMVSWAYGKLRPRRTPPEWQEPPQLGKLPRANNEADKFMVTSNLIKFEKWSSFRNKEETRENFSESEHISLKNYSTPSECHCAALRSRFLLLMCMQEDPKKAENCLQWIDNQVKQSEVPLLMLASTKKAPWN